MCRRIIGMLFYLLVLLERLANASKDIIFRFCFYLFNNFSFMGTITFVEVNFVYICRIVRLRLFPNDYEKVMKNVNRALI